MLGDTSREDKLAAARKKLKQYQKRKEAEKAKISTSRQSTPDSQVELATINGKGDIQSVSADATNYSAAIMNSENLIEKASMNSNIEEETVCKVDQGLVINPIEKVYEIINQVEVTSVTDSQTIPSMTAEDEDITEEHVVYEESDNGSSNIQNYFKSHVNQTGGHNIFEDIICTNADTNVETYFNQLIINDVYEDQKSADFTNEETQELPNLIEDESLFLRKDDDQLEVHTQTISILVAEKSALQSRLQETTINLEQKNEEILDFVCKLESSRNEVIALQESHYVIAKDLKELSESAVQSNNESALLNGQLENYRAMCDDVKSMNEELNAKLSKECDDKSHALQEVASTKGKLELANIHIQQLRDSSNEDIGNEISSLKESHKVSQKLILSLQASLAKAEASKASIEQEYKSYANHLVAQLEVAYQKITQNDATLLHLMQTKEELAAKLNLLKTERETNDVQIINEELDKFKKLCNDMTIENNALRHNFSALEMDNKALSKMCVEQRESLEKMEVAVERRDSNEVDTTQLLQAMQSDKVAASRALSQNRQLKEQLEELQNGFIMMSNKKLELTEKLEVEVHFRKRLEKEMLELSEQISLYSQMAGHKFEKLVVASNGDQAILETEVSKSDEPSIPTNNLSQLDGVPSIDASTQAAMEIIVENNQTAEAMSNEVGKASVSDDKSVEGSSVTDEAGNFIKVNTHLALENRFTSCMRELAAAQDEKQCLEHLVQRLQLETEAVGDYITIYQFQRGVMKKEVEELTSELTQLKNEREEMRSKLSSLQNLVGRLTGQNGPHDVTSMGVKPKEEIATAEVSSMEETSEVAQKDSEDKQNKQQTVRKIMSLISDMESTSQLDVSVLNKFHPCPLCSGKLINV